MSFSEALLPKLDGANARIRVPQKGFCSNIASFHFEKPIVRSPRPQDFNKWLNRYSTTSKACKPCNMNSSDQLVDSLASTRKWTTSTALATCRSHHGSQRTLNHNARGTNNDSSDKPHLANTQESSADPVGIKVRASTHFESPMLWQERGRKWDSVQSRWPAPAPLNRLKSQLIKDTSCFNNMISRGRRITERPTDLQFWRPIPAYQGHIPRHPIPMNSDMSNSDMCSTARNSYRKPCAYEKRPSMFRHNGLLSKTIVLASPNNPFNKIETSNSGKYK